MGVIVALDREDVLVETLEARADRVHGKGVGVKMHEAGVLGEDEEGAAGIEAHCFVPGTEI